MGRSYSVYMVANRKHGALYTGVTNDLVRRVHEHREGVVDGFTKKHGCKHLVWFEMHGGIEAAILREKQVKKWLRPWKDALIEETNPDCGICGGRSSSSGGPSPGTVCAGTWTCAHQARHPVDVIPALSRDPS